MSRTMEALKAAVGEKIHAAGESMGLAVALTDTELVTAKGKFFGAPTLTRYPLNGLTAIEHVPNPSANRLQLRFGTQSVMVLYGPENAADFAPLVAALKKRLGQA